MAVAASDHVGEAAASAWAANAEALRQLGATSDERLAAIIGQCAHESGGFVHRFENLNYSAAGLETVFGKYFAEGEYAQFARQPERIANRVYGNRMKNGPPASGDGWRFRGRGYIQLTGRDNYTRYSQEIGIDLVDDPDRAAEPGVAWRIAVRYMAKRRKSGKTLLAWADLRQDLMVTKGINGGTNGRVDREIKTAKALQALNGEIPVVEWQRLLLAAGFEPGPIDGLMGPKTRAAQEAASARFGAEGAALADRLRAVA
jgi:putative chitinase